MGVATPRATLHQEREMKELNEVFHYEEELVCDKDVVNLLLLTCWRVQGKGNS